jgi:hypothetical protein
MASSENPMKGKWIDLINESVHTADDVDIGDIDADNIDFIVVKKRIRKYPLLLCSNPQSRRMGWTCFVAKNHRS